MSYHTQGHNCSATQAKASPAYREPVYDLRAFIVICFWWRRTR